MRPYPSASIRSVFESGSKARQKLMTRLREMVFETAEGLEGIGTIEESLKWGQPAFSTVKPKSGSPFRIAPLANSHDKVGLYFICTTTLVQEFRERYGDELTFEGNRAIILDCNTELPAPALGHCMAMALTYKRR